MRKQHQPNTLKIELTEGCNLRCGMCGIQGIREKAGGPFVYMSIETATMLTDLLAQSGWTSKVEFAMRGEPLMNENAAAIVALFRQAMPRSQLMITTNAIPLLRGEGAVRNITDLFDAGLNVLAVDCYEASKKVEQRIRDYGARWQDHRVRLTDYPSDDSPYQTHSHKERRLFLIEDFEKAAMASLAVGTKVASNHTGAGFPPLEDPMRKRCARPFREFTVRYDGKVNLCCNDWRGIYKIGELGKDLRTIDAAWNGEALRAARVLLYDSDRSFAPCSTCDNRSYRVGLLPDPRGQDTLPKPTKAHRETAARAGAGLPMTRAVLRPWETASKRTIPIVDRAKADAWIKEPK